MNKHIDLANQNMNKVIDYLKTELTKVRTGRAQTSLVDSILVDAYEQKTPLNQVALVTTPEATSILIKPFDPNLLEAIETAITASNVGLVPNNDGMNIRLEVPALTEETRTQIAKEVKAIGEQARIKIRNARRDAIDSAKKDAELTEDQIKASEKEIQNITDKFNKTIDEMIKNKEQEVLTI